MMALSPSEISARQQTRHAEQKTALEAQIDGALTEALEAATIVVDVPVSMWASVVSEVVALYQNAGWAVELRVDFHGNRQLVFTL